MHIRPLYAHRLGVIVQLAGPDPYPVTITLSVALWAVSDGGGQPGPIRCARAQGAHKGLGGPLGPSPQGPTRAQGGQQGPGPQGPRGGPRGLGPQGPRGPARARPTRAQRGPTRAQSTRAEGAHKGPAQKRPGGPQGPGPQGRSGAHKGPRAQHTRAQGMVASWQGHRAGATATTRVEVQ